MNKFIFIFLSLFVTLPLSGGTMVRVLRIGDNATLVVAAQGGGETVLRLAGIEVTGAAGAQELLRWSIGTSWVMVEPEPQQGQGFVYVYRSPDALFVNRELVERGYARATSPVVVPASYVPVTYLGELNPPAISTETRPYSDKRTSRRSKATPARKAAGRAAAPKRKAASR